MKDGDECPADAKSSNVGANFSETIARAQTTVPTVSV